MPVLGVVLVRALRRLGIKFQRGIVQFLESELAGIKPHHRELSDHAEEVASGFQSRLCLVLVGQRLKQGSLLLCSKLQKPPSGGLFAVRIQPREASSESVLNIG